MMNEFKKAIIYITLGLVIGISSTLFIQQRRLNNLTDNYQTTIVELGATVDRLRDENRRITNLNRSVTEQLSTSEERLIRADELISTVGEGLSNSTGEIRQIIEAIEGIIRSIEQYQEDE